MTWTAIFYWTGLVVWILGGLIVLLVCLIKLSGLSDTEASMKEELEKFNGDFAAWKAERRKGPSKDHPML